MVCTVCCISVVDKWISWLVARVDRTFTLLETEHPVDGKSHSWVCGDARVKGRNVHG